MDTQNKRREQAENVLNIIAGLKPDWNRNSAPAIPACITARARSVLSNLTQIPVITPTAMPGIQFDFEDSEAGYIEFEFLEDNVVEMYFADKNSKRYIECRPTDDAIADIVNRFYAREL